jgi:hypothetical protein
MGDANLKIVVLGMKVCAMPATKALSHSQADVSKMAKPKSQPNESLMILIKVYLCGN